MTHFMDKVIGAFGNSASHFYVIYLASTAAMAIACFWLSSSKVRQQGILHFLFPRTVWLHPSALTDYGYVLLTIPLWKYFVSSLIEFAPQMGTWVQSVISTFLHTPSGGFFPGVGISVAYTVALVAVTDFKRYWVHRLMHRVPVLWEFHKVHHSAEVLTPITFYRSHPVDMLAQGVTDAVGIGLVTGIFLFLCPDGLSAVTILGANAIRFLFLFFGANLRHSHIWLSYGFKAEHVIISPAQHQIHHSVDRAHHDRNFGSEFAIWDLMFGTLFLAGKKQTLKFGLGEDEDRKLASVPQLYLRPFRALL